MLVRRSHQRLSPSSDNASDDLVERASVGKVLKHMVAAKRRLCATSNGRRPRTPSRFARAKILRAELRHAEALLGNLKRPRLRNHRGVGMLEESVEKIAVFPIVREVG